MGYSRRKGAEIRPNTALAGLWARKIAHLETSHPFVRNLYLWRWASHQHMMLSGELSGLPSPAWGPRVSCPAVGQEPRRELAWPPAHGTQTAELLTARPHGPSSERSARRALLCPPAETSTRLA